MRALLLSAAALVAALGLCGCADDISVYRRDAAGTDEPEHGRDDVESTGAAVNETDGSEPTREPATPDTRGLPSGLRRLSRREVDATISDLLGEPLRFAATYLPPDPPSRFDNDYALQSTSAAHVEGAMLIADAVVRWLAEVPSRREWLAQCDVSPIATSCLVAFVERFGRRVLRRPLFPSERDRLLALAGPRNDAAEAVDTITGALLQDPEFLYRVELGDGDPGQPDGAASKLSDWEVATRLAFLIWGRGPDDDLLDLAAAGALSTPASVAEAAQHMLLDDAARVQSDRFHAMWLDLAGRGADGLAGQMRAESAALLERVLFDERRPWAELLTARETFVDEALATHYELPWPGGSEPRWVEDASGLRRGLLAHGSVLSVGAKFGDTSPTARGKFIAERLLCREFSPPAGVNVDQPPPATEPGDCKSDRYEALASNSCATCHGQLDPIGLGLENYDAGGRWRDVESDAPHCRIDGAGELLGHGTFSGPGELGALLAGTRELTDCLLVNYLRFAVGRAALEPAESAIALEISSALDPARARFEDLVVAVVSHPSFGRRTQESLSQ